MVATIRLLLVDDHPVMRAGLANLLASEPGFDVAGQATDGLQGVRLWQELRPDVCLLDITMQGIDGIRAADPSARVVILTSSEAPEDLSQAVAAGAAGYVTKNVAHDELVQAIRSAHTGCHVISSDMQRLTTQRTGDTSPPPPGSRRAKRKCLTSSGKDSPTTRSAASSESPPALPRPMSPLSSKSSAWSTGRRPSPAATNSGCCAPPYRDTLGRARDGRRPTRRRVACRVSVARRLFWDGLAPLV